ncbi:hypothetical protein IAI10_08775 [Clostridium sp. 19966]|uniref:hypothetical protein n=1 Tax=Clostridium sp. 19966 TaxID=2768166 RepID=UPI0028DF8987|nr:hypothetical protein [Clostridium sp. 19966]MDT8716750.1 hypothetical protein [Clostridium sp. 19966]
MVGSTKVNTIKQNARMKQFIGWTTAVVFPIAILGTEKSYIPPIAALIIYWIFGGIVVRNMLSNKLPYLEMRIKGAKRELIITLIITLAAVVNCFISGIKFNMSMNNSLLAIFIFCLLNSILEPLILANIYDLAGCRIKFLGYAAVGINIIMMYALFWSKYTVLFNDAGMVTWILQVVGLGIPILIYEKTEDITIWNIQRIIYNLIVLYFGGFDIIKLLHI